MKTKVAFYGAGYLGRQVHHHVSTYYADSVEILGFIDDTRKPGEVVIGDCLSLGSLAEAMENSLLRPDQTQLIFTIGYSDMQARRVALDRVLDLGYGLFTVIHPKANIEPGAILGDGCVVLAGAVVDQQVKVGAACFLDIGVRLTAGTCVGCNNYFSSGTATGSRVVIGDNSFFGMDSTITTEVRMGSNLFVNAKTLVPRDVGDNIKLVEVHKSRELPM